MAGTWPVHSEINNSPLFASWKLINNLPQCYIAHWHSDAVETDYKNLKKRDRINVQDVNISVSLNKTLVSFFYGIRADTCKSW